MKLVLLLALFGSTLGLLFQPLGYVDRFKDVIFEFHKSHNLLLVKNNALKDCYLVRVDSLIDNLFKTKQGRYLVEDDIYKQIQSQTDETKVNLPQITLDFGDYLAKAECRNDLIFELKFTPPQTTVIPQPTTPIPTQTMTTAQPTTPLTTQTVTALPITAVPSTTVV
ncbi:hypothetical protein SNE40_013938 [Patella caerulea]|uniref:Uncharacterized protein n=1 Tax=Patella caerulea TaxID=87958 RepID=A0AAN8JG07_PATCE